MDISDISRDMKKMTKRQRLEMLASELPELIGLSRELLSFSNIIFSDLTKLRTFLASSNYGSTPSEELFVHYLDAKMSLYHSYSTNVMFAMYLRAAGKNLRAHPVMKQLLEHQYAIRNLAKVDKFYRDECRNLNSIMVSSEGASADEINRLLDRHRGSGTEGDSSEDDGGAGNDEDEDGESNEERGVIGSEDDESETDDADLLEEEEAFNRLDGARGIKRKRVSGRSRVPASADFGEFEEADDKLGLDVSKSRTGAPSLKSSLQGFLQAQNKTVKSTHGLDDQLGELGRPVKARNDTKDDSSDDSEDDGDALDDDDDESGRTPPLEGGIEALRALLRGEDPAQGGKRERRKAPDESMHGDGEETSYGNEGVGSDDSNDDDNDNVDDDGDNNLYEAFAGAKQRYMAKKKLHYTPAPRYGGVEQTVEEGGKRGASYEIIKNKGLTPHRKKANRNPRVKKRQMYAKAVIARKGQVREVVTPGAAYGGEATGIKANLSKGRKIKT
jgi:U3 small nucleolar RNA-associated protein 3